MHFTDVNKPLMFFTTSGDRFTTYFMIKSLLHVVTELKLIIMV